ncbi:hypothetical protein HanRHA438_Chr03g0119681 [Helianthus annuus]|nr:hypothetical protein HanRHA438_Chr03g0119681 [Helianthus annuus]
MSQVWTSVLIHMRTCGFRMSVLVIFYMVSTCGSLNGANLYCLVSGEYLWFS